MKCRDCDNEAYAVDLEYDEGYCEDHFRAQQRSTEPISQILYL